MNKALWTLQVLWGIFFVGSGFGKVLLYEPALYRQAPEAVSWYAAVPQDLIVFIGVCEVLGGVGLILPALTGVKPRLTPFAAVGLTLIMILAAAFHIVRGEYVLVPINVVLGAGAAFVAAGRFFETPIAAASISTVRTLKGLGVLGALALLVCAPIWYNMTRVP